MATTYDACSYKQLRRANPSQLTGHRKLIIIHDEPLEMQCGRAVLGAPTDSRDLIPSLDAGLGPALSVQSGRTIRFANPFFDVTLIVLHVENNLCVRINKLEISYCALYGGQIVHVVCRPPVMCKHRARERNVTQNQKPDRHELIFHRDTSRMKSWRILSAELQ